MTFEEASLLPRSEKITLVTIESAKAVKLFTLHSGTVYYRDVPFFVKMVKEESVDLEEVASVGAVTSGKFFYDFNAKRLYLNISDDLDPKTKNITLIYKHFFSNSPVILPHDLAGGYDIEWLPYIDSVASIGQQLDDDSTGIVLESNSDVTMINNHGYFDEIFDTLIFENKNVLFYTWFPITPISEAKLIFSGVVESKDFEQDKVRFKVKDFVYRLRNSVNLGVFSSDDGTLAESLIGTPKRRVYGQAKQMKLAGLDSVLDGYTLAGTVVINTDTVQMDGTGTNFLDELSPGDEILFTIAGTEYKFGVQTVDSDISATLNKKASLNIVNQAVIVSPKVPYREYNRFWHIAGHILREPMATITNIIANNRFEVDTTQDMYAGDQVNINGDLVTIRRISGNEIVTQNAVSPVPVVSDEFMKIAVQRVYFGNKELIYLRDWNYINTTEAIVEINDLAEFNVTQEELLNVNLTFTNNSRSLTTISTIDFKSILKPRDWIRKNSTASGENEWHEILEVKEQEILLRSPYTGSTATTSALAKVVEYISDESLILCDCLGKEVDGEWMKTPPDAVRDLVLNDAEFESVNETSFSKAKADCDYILSLVIPENIGDKSPQIRDVITNINESCFGSLYGDSSLAISYSIMNSEKPELTEVLRDDDIISFSTESVTNIYNNIVVNFRPFVDKNTGERSFEVLTYNSGFVDNYVGVKNTLEKTLYLYEQDKANIIAQRYALFSSLTNTKVSLKGKMLFFLNSVNDKVFLSLDRLYKRFGGEDRRKIGTIISIKKGQTEVDLTFADMGNIFNRVPAIAPNVANDFSLADNDEKVLWGYIVDSQILTPDPTSEDFINCNIIG